MSLSSLSTSSTSSYPPSKYRDEPLLPLLLKGRLSNGYELLNKKRLATGWRPKMRSNSEGDYTQSKKAEYYSFTTVTSATGLPAWEPGPSQARSSSSGYWKPEEGGGGGKEEERPKGAESGDEIKAPNQNGPCCSHNHVNEEKKADDDASPSSSTWTVIEDKKAGRRGSGSPLEPPPPVVQTRDGCEFRLAELQSDPLLNRIADWALPIFDLAAKNPQTVLSKMCYTIFEQADLFRTFKISHTKFFNFFHALERGYWEIPYHNRIHAADVLHAVYYLVVHPVQPFVFDDVEAELAAHSASASVRSSIPFSVLLKLRGGIGGWTKEKKETTKLPPEDYGYAPLGTHMSNLELLALFTAAAMHDYDHPGRTNAFLVATVDPKAILYNDRSVLENHHAAESWKLLQQPGNYFIENLDEAETRRFRYLVLEYILATDLKQHFEIILNFAEKMTDLRLSQEADRVMICRMLIKLADVNSPSKPYPLHLQWTERICSEFYTQGDEEKRLGIKVTAYMDRDSPGVAKLQHSFISHLVAPLVDVMNTASLLPVLPGLEEPEVMINLKHNLDKWSMKLIETGELVIEEPSKEEQEYLEEMRERIRKSKINEDDGSGSNHEKTPEQNGVREH